MARRLRPEGEEEGADEALQVQEFRAVDEVRLPRTLMPRRMESQLRRRLHLEARRRLQAQPRPRVEQVPQVDKAQQADRAQQAGVDPHRQRLLAPAGHRRAVALRTGQATERPLRGSS